MKTFCKQSHRPRPARLTPRRIRLAAPRLPKRPAGDIARSTVAFDPVAALPAKEVHAAELQEFKPQAGALELYLREIGQVKLLTAEEELALAKRIKRGDKQAREHMIKANLRLVVKIARDYEGLGLPLLDLINEGNIGLMKGVERFDPAKGAKLSTYASWWIKQSIKRALANQSKTIRLPIHVVEKVSHIRRAEVKLQESLAREPTDDELADELAMHPRRVREYRDASRAPVSLDAPLGADESDSVSEIVPDANAEAPFDQLVRDNDNKLALEVLGTLTQRQREILTMRYGLQDGEPKTLEEIGQHFGLTRERIRQIQEQALQEVRLRMQKRDRAAHITTFAE